MKRFLASFLLAVTLFVSIPVKKADAGIIFIATSVEAFSKKEYVQGVAGIAFAVINFSAAQFFNFFHADFFTVLFFALDADPTMSQGDLERIMSDRYPFINNEAVIGNLAKAVKSKLVVGKDMIVRLQTSEIKSILSAADLSESEVALVVSELN